jgi:hypothetical protein
VGCAQCGYTGFIGRRYGALVIPCTGEFINLLNSAGKADEVMEYLAGKGVAIAEDFSEKNREQRWQE